MKQNPEFTIMSLIVIVNSYLDNSVCVCVCLCVCACVCVCVCARGGGIQKTDINENIPGLAFSYIIM